MEEQELTPSQQRQLALLRKRREELIISQSETVPEIEESVHHQQATIGISLHTSSAFNNNNSMKNNCQDEMVQTRGDKCATSDGDDSKSQPMLHPFKLLNLEILEHRILPFFTLRVILNVGLLSKNQIPFCWTCLRKINEIHLKRFPNLMSNAMIEDQMDHVMAKLFRRTSVITTNVMSNSSIGLGIGSAITNYDAQRTITNHQIAESRRDKHPSWPLGDGLPLTSATLARRSMRVGSLRIDHHTSNVNASFTSVNSTTSEGTDDSNVSFNHSRSVSSFADEELSDAAQNPSNSLSKLVSSVKRFTRRKVFRIALVGERNVGKTTLIQSIFGGLLSTHSSQIPTYKPTQQTHTVCHPYYLMNGERIDLVIHDTCPENLPDQYKSSNKEIPVNEKYSEHAKILRACKKKVDLFLYCFDVSEEKTLPSSSNTYFKKFCEIRENNFPKSTVALIGLKQDIAEYHQLRHHEDLVEKLKRKSKIGSSSSLTTHVIPYVTYVQATQTAQDLNIFKAFLGCCSMKNMFNTLHLFNISISLMYSEVLKKRLLLDYQIIGTCNDSSQNNNFTNPTEELRQEPFGTIHSTPAPVNSTGLRRASGRLSVLGRKFEDGWHVLMEKIHAQSGHNGEDHQFGSLYGQERKTQ